MTPVLSISEKKARQRAYDRKWYLKNGPAYYLKNRDRILACYKANRDKIRIRQKAYRQKNRARRKAYDKAYRDRNHDRVRAKEKAFREKNRVKLQAYLKTWREANLDKIKDTRLRKKYGISFEQWNKVFDIQGRRCAICKTSEFGQKGPQTDHCGIGGHFRGILCSNCNSALGSFRHSEQIVANAQEYLSKEVLFNGVKAA